MPSKSKKQQRFMGMVYNCKETGDCPGKKVKDAAKGISKKKVKEFASTKHKGLPTKVKKKKKSFMMLKELIKIANELDGRGLAKEADVIDIFIFKHALNIEDIKEVVWNAPKRQWSKGVGETLEAAGEEASEVISDASQAAFDAILNNPENVEWASIFAKGAGITMALTGVGAGPGILLLKGSTVADVAAAFGYFEKGKNLNGWFSLLAAAVIVPATITIKGFNSFRKLRALGGFGRLKSKYAWIEKIRFGLLAFVEIMLALVNSATSEAVALMEKSAPRIIKEKEKIISNMKTSGNELIAELKRWRSDLL